MPRSRPGPRPGEYALTETGLPLDFDLNFNAVLVALVAAGVAPATARQGGYLVAILEPVAGRLKHCAITCRQAWMRTSAGGERFVV